MSYKNKTSKNLAFRAEISNYPKVSKKIITVVKKSKTFGVGQAAGMLRGTVSLPFESVSNSENA